MSIGLPLPPGGSISASVLVTPLILSSCVPTYVHVYVCEGLYDAADDTTVGLPYYSAVHSTAADLPR